jgi:hypothetical protein
VKDRKITEREFSVPMLGGAILPMSNASFDLGYDFPTMCLIAFVSCFYALARMWFKVQQLKYACTPGVCKTAKPAEPAPAAAAVPKPAPPA